MNFRRTRNYGSKVEILIKLTNVKVNKFTHNFHRKLFFEKHPVLEVFDYFDSMNKKDNHVRGNRAIDSQIKPKFSPKIIQFAMKF